MSSVLRTPHYVCTFCRHVSSSSRLRAKPVSRSLPEAPRAQAHAPKDNTKWMRGRTKDGSSPASTEAVLQQPKQPFALRYRARLAWFTPKFLRQRPLLRTLIKTVLLTVPITGFVLLHFPFDFPTISGPSMSPTLNPNSANYNSEGYDDRDRVVVQKWSPNDWRERNMRRAQLIEQGKYKRGQIVVFHGPHDPEKIVVKRIVGVPGDRVTPMKGYNGQEEPEPVIIRYNHLWVEGDVNDRNKSWDSNWYGPISQNLVVGEVKAVYRPWKLWTITRVDYKKHTWPAKATSRVEEGAVASASINPDVVSINDGWKNGKNEKVLKLITERPEFALKNFESSPKQRGQYRQFYLDAILVVRGSEDKDKKALAAKIIRAMEDLFSREALREGRTVVKTNNNDGKTEERKRNRWRPESEEDRDNVNNPLYFTDADVHEEEGARQREEKLRPAKAALRKMMEQNRNLADEKQKEIDHIDRQREAKEGIAASWSLKGIFSEENSKDKSA